MRVCAWPCLCPVSRSAVVHAPKAGVRRATSCTLVPTDSENGAGRRRRRRARDGEPTAWTKGCRWSKALCRHDAAVLSSKRACVATQWQTRGARTCRDKGTRPDRPRQARQSGKLTSSHFSGIFPRGEKVRYKQKECRRPRKKIFQRLRVRVCRVAPGGSGLRGRKFFGRRAKSWAPGDGTVFNDGSSDKPWKTAPAASAPGCSATFAGPSGQS